ncbi:MAG TPA: class I SAM-dependent methyltransferase [Bryobacteraceae bacterium]|jgi:SAM-dependent methyltransferase|nr:class I SAM-dependent methyltransferase [Bryobacteraceae bacterium]
MVQVHEILENLPTGTFVLDLGCDEGSFSGNATAAHVIRVDRDRPSKRKSGENFVQADAAKLPFADHCFAAVISNHSLEHFDDFTGALAEIGRITSPDGSLFVAVPDASTLTDKIYRWLASGGGHVNAFVSGAKTAALIEQAAALPLVATKTLCSSLSFLNRRNSPRPIPRRLWLLGGGYEWSLFLYVWLSRRLDRALGTRTSVYGWAFYFGRVERPVDTDTWVNVCIRCGSGCPAGSITARSAVPGLAIWHCTNCGASNPFTG